MIVKRYVLTEVIKNVTIPQEVKFIKNKNIHQNERNNAMETEEALSKNDPFVTYKAAEKLLNRPVDENNYEQINRDLVARVQAGDKRALNELVIRNYRLVRVIVHKMTKPGTSVENLAQGGMIGLINAAKKFDVKLGYMFSTYAGWWIRAGIHKELSAEQFIRLSAATRNTFSHLLEFQAKFSKQFDRAPTRDEMAHELANHEYQLRYKKSATDEAIVRRLSRCLAVVDILFDSRNSESLDELDSGGSQNTPGNIRENLHLRDYENLNPLDYCLAREALKAHQNLLAKIMETSKSWKLIYQLVLEKRILALPEEQLTLEAVGKLGTNEDGSPHKYSRQRIEQYEMKIVKKLAKELNISSEKIYTLRQVIDELTKLVNS